MTEPKEKSTDPGDLRTQLDAALKETKALKAQLRPFQVAEAGFPPGSPANTHIVDFYQGDLQKTDEVLTFAKKYGFTPVEEPEEPPAPSNDKVTDAQARVDDLASGGKPLDGDAFRSEINKLNAAAQEAEREGNHRDAITLMNRVYDLRRKAGLIKAE